VFIAAGGGEQSSGSVVNILKFIEDFVGRTKENAVAVRSGGYEGMDENVSGGRGQGGPEACNVPGVKEGSFGDLVGERQGGVEDDTKVSDLDTGGDDGAINVERLWRRGPFQ